MKNLREEAPRVKALCLWSLNHVMDVRRSVAEAMRVLAGEGRLLVVLEDSEPSWRDLWTGRYPNAGIASTAYMALRKLARPALGWPLQPDHIEIAERDLEEAAGGRVRRRAWIGLYLTLELEAPPAGSQVNRGCAPDGAAL